MKQITVFETYDGKRHDSVRDAIKYLERKYAEIISPIGHKLVQMSFTEIQEYIDANLDKFAELSAIKKDEILQDGDEE